MKRYAVYHLRWQLSALVMMPFLWLLNKSFDFSPEIDLMIVQAIGALIFWNIDSIIFRNYG